MATQLKHRLVGMIILVALCVILLPDLLDGKKQQLVLEGEAIPLAPPFPEPELPAGQAEPVPLAQPVSKPAVAAAMPEAVPDKPVTVSTASSAQSKPVTRTATQPAADSQLPELTESAWIVRLGAFRQMANAQKLLQQLRDAGYKAYSVPAEGRMVDGELTRVYVGPDLSKASLEAQQPALAQLTGLEGTITRYNPVKS